MPDDTEVLRAEVTELRAEVERLRTWQNSHVCATATPQVQWFPNTVANAAACPPPVFTIPPGQAHVVNYQTTACAGAPPPQVMYFNT